MTTRLDLAIAKHPDQEAAIRLFAERDPSGNLKYLHWQLKVLTSGQALAPEIADVTDLFHRFSGQSAGQRRPHSRRQDIIRPDLYSYAPKDLAALHELLRKAKRAQDKKRRARERLYRIEGAVEADVVYESADLIVRHIKNKAASVHYGLGTKWCIAMNRENYFSDYDAHNATFFFFERKTPRGDDFDKCAVMVERSISGWGVRVSGFTALDECVDLFGLAIMYGGSHVFDIFRSIYERSRSYPGSPLSRVYAGTATAEQLSQSLDAINTLSFYDVERLLLAICCNDAASWPLLARILHEVVSIAQRRTKLRKYRRSGHLIRRVRAAASIHPQVPEEERVALTKKLRQCHVNTSTIRIDRDDEGVHVVYRMRGEPDRRIIRGRRHYRRRRWTPSQMERHAGVLERRAKRLRVKLKTMKAKAKKKGKR
jgi:hypothetical protein